MVLLKFYIVVCALFLATPLSLNGAEARLYKLPQVTVEEVDFIITESLMVGGVQVKKRSSFSGTAWNDYEHQRMKRTDQISLEKENGFNVKFFLNGKYKDLKSVTLNVICPKLIHPEKGIINKITRVEPVQSELGRRIVHFGYSFDEDWEMKEGIWIIQIFHSKKQLGKLSIQVKHKG